MSTYMLRLLERIHGHAGWLAVAILFHPAVILRRPHRRAPVAVLAATALVTLVGLLGAVLYPTYSRTLRRTIYMASIRHGLFFERKEHFAYAAIALAWAGCSIHLWGQSTAANDAGRTHRARFAHIAFVGAASCALASAVLGTLVAAFRSW